MTELKRLVSENFKEISIGIAVCALLGGAMWFQHVETMEAMKFRGETWTGLLEQQNRIAQNNSEIKERQAELMERLITIEDDANKILAAFAEALTTLVEQNK